MSITFLCVHWVLIFNLYPNRWGAKESQILRLLQSCRGNVGIEFVNFYGEYIYLACQFFLKVCFGIDVKQQCHFDLNHTHSLDLLVTKWGLNVLLGSDRDDFRCRRAVDSNLLGLILAMILTLNFQVKYGISKFRPKWSDCHEMK